MTTLVPPHVEDGQLLFDASETRQILLFFWPMRSDDINAMPVDNPLRRFAQSILNLHRLNMHRDGVANTQPLSPFVLAGMAPDAAAWV